MGGVTTGWCAMGVPSLSVPQARSLLLIMSP